MNRAPDRRSPCGEREKHESRQVGGLGLGRDAVPTLPTDYRETPKRKTSFWEYCSPGRRMPLG